MDTLKKFAKYIVGIIAFSLFTSFLVFVGFNANYKKIENKTELPSAISIEKAEAKSDQGRIYGKIKNDEAGSLTGKYIKNIVYNELNEIISTEYLKIDELKQGEEKLFKITFYAKNAKFFEISIVENINM